MVTLVSVLVTSCDSITFAKILTLTKFIRVVALREFVVVYDALQASTRCNELEKKLSKNAEVSQEESQIFSHVYIYVNY